jgi:biopolymer transport protein ExbD
MRFDKIRKRQEEGEFQIAPMIDIVFLLLIFFICAATIKKMEKELKITLPDTSQIPDENPNPPMEIIIIVKKTGATDNVFEIQDQGAFSLGQIRDKFRNLHAASPNQLIIIRGEPEASHGNIVKILDLCAEIGLKQVSIAIMEE